MFFVYILECSDGTLYTGYTKYLRRRVSLHNSGRASKYTRARRPVLPLYFEEYKDQASAMRRERQIKKMPREKKLALAGGVDYGSDAFSLRP